VDDANGKSVFYLQGMAGTGKSTISRTVAQHLVERADRPLVATFFFKRGEEDRVDASRVITTLTSQLISREPVLAASVKRAIDANHAITNRPMGEQFEQLILRPLEGLKPGKSRTVVIIIDALDECRSEDDIRQLIYQIFRGANMKSDTIRWRASRPASQK
jgi:Cdc6-like AAA superfamily ATPase